VTARSDSAAAPRRPQGHSNSRGVTVTWWYTAAALVFFEGVLVATWSALFLRSDPGSAAGAAVLVGGLVWIGSTLPPLLAYRHRTADPAVLRWQSALLPLLVAVAFGVLAFSLSGYWLLLVTPLAQSLQFLDWPGTVRTRLVVAVTVLLTCLAVIDTNVEGAGRPLDLESGHFVLGFLSATLPVMTVLSLWWWDVLIALDRARVSEARLAATQERLKLATDVHDLQGHHLQVIALQLELTERLLAADPAAALEQLKAARISVDEARQGTRDLATRFRSVPLRDELENARDLLRAAGIAAETTVAPDADSAPADVFGPVIRETTTNVLRHGGGGFASLGLSAAGGSWRYSISNDTDAAVPASQVAGSGLEGIERRARDAGGTFEVVRGEDEFTVIVTVPAEAEGAA
jgi:two-component system sensor histidine kinase DesK